jgi:hypothetical protein
MQKQRTNVVVRVFEKVTNPVHSKYCKREVRGVYEKFVMVVSMGAVVEL